MEPLRLEPIRVHCHTYRNRHQLVWVNALVCSEGVFAFHRTIYTIRDLGTKVKDDRRYKSTQTDKETVFADPKNDILIGQILAQVTERNQRLFPSGWSGRAPDCYSVSHVPSQCLIACANTIQKAISFMYCLIDIGMEETMKNLNRRTDVYKVYSTLMNGGTEVLRDKLISVCKSMKMIDFDDGL